MYVTTESAVMNLSIFVFGTLDVLYIRNLYSVHATLNPTEINQY